MKRLLALFLAFSLLASPLSAFAAVGFGAISAVDNAISRTSVAVSGSNTVGIVFVSGDTGSDSINSVTWNSVSMTKINAVQTPGDRWNSVWCINNPASATTIAFNDNADNYWRNYNAYYTEAVCPPVDSSNTGTTASASSISVATTVVDAGSWVIAFQKGASGGRTYSASDAITTMRVATDDASMSIADSNGATGSGSKTATQTITAGANEAHSMITFSLAPYAVPVVSTASMMSLVRSFWIF